MTGSDLLCLDVGSTFTKAVLVGADGEVRGTAETLTTRRTDVLHGCHALAEELGAGSDTTTLACSSAGGGLRLAVVGYERQVTAEAGYRVGLSAGAKVVHVASGRLDASEVKAVGRSLPDLVLLVGGTDGGNSEVLLHNAAQLARAALGRPVVVAGNVDARDEVVALLRGAGQPVRVADNVVPEIGEISPGSARAAIRATFLDHVIGGKGLSSSPSFREMVRAPTPDAVLRGAEVTAEEIGSDLLVVDVGGATTDVYSVVTPEGEDATLRKDVVGTLWHARTVEGDLGVRWNAVSVVEAAARERIPVGVGTAPVCRGGRGRPRPPAGRRRRDRARPPAGHRRVAGGGPSARAPRRAGGVAPTARRRRAGPRVRRRPAPRDGRAGCARARRRHRRPRRRVAGAEVGADRRRRGIPALRRRPAGRRTSGGRPVAGEADRLTSSGLPGRSHIVVAGG